MYRFYNANIKNNFVNDCTIRAISTVEDKSWSETYKELSELAMIKGLMIEDVNFIEPLLDSKYRRVRFSVRTIGDFVESHPEGKYLLCTPGHITCCVSGVLIDTWDCRGKKLTNVWKVE